MDKAKMYKEVSSTNIPMFVDTMDNAAEAAFAAWYVGVGGCSTGFSPLSHTASIALTQAGASVHHSVREGCVQGRERARWVLCSRG